MGGVRSACRGPFRYCDFAYNADPVEKRPGNLLPQRFAAAAVEAKIENQSPRAFQVLEDVVERLRQAGIGQPVDRDVPDPVGGDTPGEIVPGDHDWPEQLWHCLPVGVERTVALIDGQLAAADTHGDVQIWRWASISASNSARFALSLAAEARARNSSLNLGQSTPGLRTNIGVFPIKGVPNRVKDFPPKSRSTVLATVSGRPLKASKYLAVELSVSIEKKRRGPSRVSRSTVITARSGTMGFPPACQHACILWAARRLASAMSSAAPALVTVDGGNSSRSRAG